VNSLLNFLLSVVRLYYALSWRITGMNAKRGFVADLLTQKEVPEKKKGRCNRVSKL